MNIFQRVIIGFLSCLMILGFTVQAQAQQARDPVFEQEILTRLQAINPRAVDVFIQATSAWDARDFVTAKAGFEKVLSLAPDFPDALRRLSSVESSLDLIDSALVHAQKAFDLDPSPYNKSNLARVFVEMNTPESMIKAYNLAKEAVQEIPDDPTANMSLMIAAGQQNDTEAIRMTSERLNQLMPENPLSHYYSGLVLATEGKFERAEAELLRAGELGLPAEVIDQTLKETGIATQARILRALRGIGYAFAAWLIGLLILFGVGLILNRAMLAAVRNAEAGSLAAPSRGELRLRSLYRFVIGLISAYYYLSIPFMILMVVTLGFGVIYIFFRIGSIPLRLVIIVLIFVFYTLVAIVRSIFTRFKQGEPGRPLDNSEAPEFWQLTTEIANRLQTRPIQAVYLTPGSDFAVFEQGGALQKARGRGIRTLLLGLGVLPGMTQGQLKSVIAHEYGHFARKDTAGGDIAYQAQRSMYVLAARLAQSGQAHWFNPVWLFLNGFYRVFLRITRGASRLQEILADRYAAIAFGARNFKDGLRHIVGQSLAFGFQVNQQVEQAVENEIPLTNLYTASAALGLEDERKLAEAIEKALNTPSGAYDSHPSPAERFRLVEALHLSDTGSEPGDEAPAWDLLSDAQALQEELTAEIQAALMKSQRWNKALGS